MPGFKRLDDKQFIKAFQVTDRVIQNNHPLFLLVWIGSAIALIILAFYAYKSLHGVDFFPSCISDSCLHSWSSSFNHCH